MKASDINDEEFLEIIRRYNDGEMPDKLLEWPGTNIEPYMVTGPRWAFVWDLAEYFNVSEKIIRAKAAKLIKRGRMDGCTCGCRGDFEVYVE